MCVSEICCHRRGASRDFERSRFTSRDHSGVPVAGRHWQSVESAAFRSWPFKIPSARVDQLHVSFFSKLFLLTGRNICWPQMASSVGSWMPIHVKDQMGTLILARSSINRRLHSLGRYALRSSFLLGGVSCANARVCRQHRSTGTGKCYGGPHLR